MSIGWSGCTGKKKISDELSAAPAPSKSASPIKAPVAENKPVPFTAVKAKPQTTAKETPSLKNIFNRPKEEAKNEKATGDTATPEVVETTAITKESVASALQSMSEKLALGVSVKNILKRPFELNGEDIIFPISNKVETSMIQNQEVEILDFLRKTLKNSLIKLVYQFSENQEERKPYTSSEIFAVMAKKNPHILKLKDELGLDTEF